MKLRLNLLLTILFFLSLAGGAFGQTSKPLDIQIKRSQVLLNGKFYLSNGAETSPTLLILHGMPGNEKDVLGIGTRMSQMGFNVLAFNYSGTHGSQGKWSYDNVQKDISAAYKYLHEPDNIRRFKIDTSRIAIGGWSFGGGMALVYGSKHPEARVVFAIAGSDSGEFMRQYSRSKRFASSIDHMFDTWKYPSGPIRFGQGTTPREITSDKIKELEGNYDLRLIAPQLIDKHVLLIGGWNDQNVTIEDHVLPLYRSLKKAKAKQVRIVALQDNHVFGKTRDALAETLSEWLNESF